MTFNNRMGPIWDSEWFCLTVKRQKIQKQPGVVFLNEKDLRSVTIDDKQKNTFYFYKRAKGVYYKHKEFLSFGTKPRFLFFLSE